jgi:peptide/nickel transport system permease protein
MQRFIIRRVLSTLLSLLAVSLIVFGLARIQGDPRTVMLDEFTSQVTYDEWGTMLGLDKPLYYQYGLFVGKLVRGDLGRSEHQNRPVADLIRERLPATLQLAFVGLLIAIVVGIPLGVLSAVSRGTVADYVGRWFAILGISLPAFWVGLMAMLLFAVKLGWLPTSGRGGIDHLVLPGVVVGWHIGGALLRLMRSSMLDVLDSEYIKLARSKGVHRWLVIWKHAMRNAMIAPITYAGVVLAGLITGTIIVEAVFAWPGVGLLALQAVSTSDYNVMQGVIVVITAVYLLTSLLVDISYGWIDPRIRLS